MDVVLSIGIILENNAHNISRCLLSLQPLRNQVACQMILISDHPVSHCVEPCEQVILTSRSDIDTCSQEIRLHCRGRWLLLLSSDECLCGDCAELLPFLSDTPAEDRPHIVLPVHYRGDSMRSDSALRAITPLSARTLGPSVSHPAGVHTEIRSERLFLLSDSQLFQAGPECASNVPSASGSAPTDLLSAALSADSAAHAMPYLIQLLTLAAATADDELGSFVYAVAASLTSDGSHPNEHAQLVQQGMARYPSARSAQIDLNFYAALQDWNDHNFIALLRHCQAYLAAFDRIQESQPLPIPLLNAGPDCQQAIVLLCALAQANSANYEAALDRLASIPIEALADSNVPYWLETVSVLQVFHDFTKEIASLNALYWGESAPRKDKCEDLEQLLFSTYLWSNNSRPLNFLILNILSQLWPGDLMRMANILCTSTKEDYIHWIDQIQDWSLLPFPVLWSLYSLDLFPEAFYALTLEQMSAILARCQESILNIPLRDTPLVPESGPHLLWEYMITLAYLKNTNWDHVPSEVRDLLLLRYARQTEAFLHWYCPSEILTSDSVSHLPALLRFGWFYINAEQALSRQDFSGYISGLHNALNTAPEMQPMVSFLIKQFKREELRRSMPPNLVQMADKINIIAQVYTYNHPVNRDIVSSPVFPIIKPLLA